MPPGTVLDALTSAKGHPHRICSDDPGDHRSCFGSLTSRMEHSIRNLTSRSFASEVFHVALASAKGRPHRGCLDDLSRHSRPPHIVVICDKASDVKHANAIGNQAFLLSTFHRFSALIRRALSNSCALPSSLSQHAQMHLQPAVEIASRNASSGAIGCVHVSHLEGSSA